MAPAPILHLVTWVDWLNRSVTALTLAVAAVPVHLRLRSILALQAATVERDRAEQALQHSHAQLEARVQERTRELHEREIRDVIPPSEMDTLIDNDIGEEILMPGPAKRCCQRSPGCRRRRCATSRLHRRGPSPHGNSASHLGLPHWLPRRPHYSVPGRQGSRVERDWRAGKNARSPRCGHRQRGRRNPTRPQTFSRRSLSCRRWSGASVG